MRAMFVEFAAARDELVCEDAQYMLGGALLVRPVVRENAVEEVCRGWYVV
jgi:alpha-glucosidase (family GH31 glycosyl hydrolase)